jgi:hypothetical protein
MSDHSFYLEAQCINLIARVTINGATAYETWTSHPGVGRIRADHLLAPGQNLLEVHLAHAAVRHASEDPAFELALLRTFRGELPSAHGTLLRYRWTEDTTVLDQERLTPVLEHVFRVVSCPARWAWEGATPFGTDPGDERAALDPIRRLYRALDERDLGAVARELSLRHTELGLAVEVPRDEVEADALEVLGSLMADPDAKLQPLSERDIVLDPRFAGRLVHVRDRDGRPPIRYSIGDRVASLPVSVAHLGDGFRIVR